MAKGAKHVPFFYDKVFPGNFFNEIGDLGQKIRTGGGNLEVRAKGKGQPSNGGIHRELTGQVLLGGILQELIRAGNRYLQVSGDDREAGQSQSLGEFVPP